MLLANSFSCVPWQSGINRAESLLCAGDEALSDDFVIVSSAQHHVNVLPFL